jgi:hypothetical protein
MDRDDIIWMYRIFLAREPESEEAIRVLLNSGKTRLEMIKEMMASEEFASKHLVD